MLLIVAPHGREGEKVLWYTIWICVRILQPGVVLTHLSLFHDAASINCFCLRDLGVLILPQAAQIFISLITFDCVTFSWGVCVGVRGVVVDWCCVLNTWRGDRFYNSVREFRTMDRAGAFQLGHLTVHGPEILLSWFSLFPKNHDYLCALS